MWGRISALFLLGLALLKTLLLRTSSGSSLRQFEQHYGKEGILPVDVSSAKILGRASRCTACGRCDAGEGARVAASATGYKGMLAFVSAGVRSLPDYGAVAHTITGVPEEAFVSAERSCPEGVPLLELARLVRREGDRLDRIR